MTDQKNTPPSKIPSPPADFNQEVNQLPLHTMKKDFSHLLNPNAPEERKTPLPPSIEKERQKNNSFQVPSDSRPHLTASPNLSKPPRTSPFFPPASPSRPAAAFSSAKLENKTFLPPSAKEKEKEKEKEIPQEKELPFKPKETLNIPKISQIETSKPVTPKPLEEAKITPHPFQWTKIIYLSLFFSTILLFSFGGYYFWLTKNTPTAPAPLDTPLENFSFSSESPNYLNISQLTTVELQAKISKYAEKITETSTTVPVEFILTNAKNEPVNFSEFSNILGLNISPALAETFNGNFSLFINNDNGQKATGLVIDLADEEKLKSIIRQEEKNLALSLFPLFLESPQNDEDWLSRDFNSNYYRDIEIRYINIISPEKLSVDYTVYQQQLIISTTKETIRDMLDHLGLTNQSANEGSPSGITPTE